MNAGDSFVLHESGRRHFWQGVGRLSIKSFRGGRAFYESGPARYAVDDGSYLVLNEGQPYSIRVESPRPVESFCVFFADGLAGEVRRSLASPAEALLDDPQRAADPLRFFERTYPHDPILSPRLFRLRADLAEGGLEAGRLRERLHGLVDGLLRARTRIQRDVARLPAARASTREELYRRLHRARDYAAACFEGPVSLDDLAGAACLSPTHLLRSFRSLFGQSPHQYLTGLRLQRAAQLLVRTERPVTDICLDVGFESLGSFSALFRRQHGLSPREYRDRKR